GCWIYPEKIVRSGEELEEVMEDIELLRLEKRRRKAKLKFFGLDVPNHPDFNQEGLADGFDVNNSCYPSMLVKSTWGDDYDIALYGRLGLHCHNFHKGTNFKFGRWEKYSVISTAYDYVYVTLDAKDPVSGSVFSFQTLLNEDSSPDRPVMWTTLACRIKCENAADARWDDKAVDDFYKDAIPKWSSDEELARGKKNYYVVQESELQENDWLYLFTEIAFYSKTNNCLRVLNDCHFNTFHFICTSGFDRPYVRSLTIIGMKKEQPVMMLATRRRRCRTWALKSTSGYVKLILNLAFQYLNLVGDIILKFSN
ncbi:unnamed protein product, partial [Brassica napus]